MTEFGKTLRQLKADLLDELKSEVNYRNSQMDLLFNLLMKTDQFLYPNLHAYGLSGTGKTFTIRSFMQKFADFKRQAMMNRTLLSNYKAVPNYYFVYFDCAEICHVSISVLFYEILAQVRNILVDEKAFSAGELDDLESYQAMACGDGDDEIGVEVGVGADYSNFVRQLKKYVRMLAEVNKPSNVNILIVFDNADNFKFISDASNLILTIFKLNEYVNCNEYSTSTASRQRVRLTNLFVSEIDWHSVLSDCELMSRTETPRPFIIFFDEYNKDQMCVILKKTASYLVSLNAKSAQYQAKLRAIKDNMTKSASTNADQDESQMYQHMESLNSVEFYAQIILEVFFPICKDLNEIQYLIQMYYDQVMSSINTAMSMPAGEEESSEGKKTDSAYKRMMKVWKTMQPFLRQALTQIYLRQSTFQFSTHKQDTAVSKTTADVDGGLSKEFESLNLEKTGDLALSMAAENNSFSQLPKVMKILLISAYICTHNPTKYDKKLFDYNSTVKSRKNKHTAHKQQQNDEQQRSAALKMQTFDMNRLLAIFFAICAENGFDQVLNLSLIQMSIQTLKSLNYLQQTNSSYSLDESKFKCLLDLASVERISSSVQFNIRQHLAEFISI